MKTAFLIIALSFIAAPSAIAATPAPCVQDPNTPGTEYCLLQPIPLNGPGTLVDKTTTLGFLPGFIKLIIGIATVLAVVMVIYGGFQYVLTAASDGKSAAKATIENAIWGLLLAIGAWVILYTINPRLVELNLNITPLPIATSTSGTAGGGGQGPGTGPQHLALTAEQARTALEQGGVTVNGAINLGGLRQIVVDELVALRGECVAANANCKVVVTSATGGSHNPGTCSHSSGYKVDLRNNAEGTTLTNYIKTFEKLPNRSDGAQMYRSSRGALYALESNHWDVVRCN